LPLVRLVRPAPHPLDLHAGRTLPAVLEPTQFAADPARPVTQDDAVKRWAASTYALPFAEIERVTFDVQHADIADPGAPSLELEIDVRMTDGHQHLFVRRVCEFGQIIDEVLAATH
jgi:hypothetical protein